MKDFNFPCPCCKGGAYQDCCRAYHLGKEAENALILMRSRYSAYALNDVDYIIRTTHPKNQQASQPLAVWRQSIVNFSLHTTFVKLEILDFKELGEVATVVFVAHLRQGGEEASFTERSFFEKQEGRWLYLNGDFFPGVRDLSIITLAGL